ncbi:D-tagatose-bisphosphate aldolase, class II, non-catalytic subunit [Terriglobus aquaticus]|uniref:D-tagatose-bisphosphate aldolase, class II, non-catalytic subunit n=1 Tax=Terriglobus aquaticus TaxID=940139 RepID=A0ABW9KNR1_9BACT|nr:D-tagatose-bisphosphate aldolase, class II, non-catalytic subunit [Terriglobus aquaticus]
MAKLLQEHLAQRQRGVSAGIYSVCSAHPWVIRAAAEQAKEDGTLLLVEATSNQVNQFGGYTGMRPADFRSFVLEHVEAAGLDPVRLLLGGDHLGPNPWRKQPAEAAMAHAVDMVAEYVRAGFTKIHLDASMACAGDPSPLSDRVVAERAAALCAAAEAARPGTEPIVYVIGTEVPVPGGATHAVHELEATTPEAAAQTLQVHREVFREHGLESAWPSVIALVVQPGVEFDHDAVIDYDRNKAADLVRWLPSSGEHIVFEAHSTDYQRPTAYRELVEDGFAILKVGPALTFAMREALDALEDMEAELVPETDRSHLYATLERVMLAHPDNWLPYYHGSPEEQKFLRHYSYSDRVRYYWNDSEVRTAVERLVQNLQARTIADTMLSRYLPQQYKQVRNGSIANDPASLIVDKIRDVLREYAAACEGVRAT